MLAEYVGYGEGLKGGMILKIALVNISSYIGRACNKFDGNKILL
jgi:hypothetical protein